AVAEIRLREIRGARPPHHGTPVRGLETQSPPHADRRRRPSGEVVFRVEERHAGSEEEWRGVSTSDERAGDVEVEKLKKAGRRFQLLGLRKGRTSSDSRMNLRQRGFPEPNTYSPTSQSIASSRVLNVTISRWEKPSK